MVSKSLPRATEPRTPPIRLRRSKRGLSGLTTIEVLASASIIALLISTTATLCLRIQRIDREAQIDQLALQELANTLEQNLADGASNDVFEISPSLRLHWPEAFIESSRSTDAIGDRLSLRLYRSRNLGVKPLELSGWIPSAIGESP